MSPATIDPGTSHPFVAGTDLDQGAAALGVQYCWQTGLIKRIDLEGGTQAWQLTQKGFDVAHERESRAHKLNHERRLNELQEEHREELQKQQFEHERRLTDRQQKSNNAIVVLTVTLVFASIADSLVSAAVGANEPPIVITAIGAIPAVIFLVVLIGMYRHGLFPEKFEQTTESEASS